MLLTPHTWRLPNWPAGLTWPAISGSACLPRSLRGQFTLALTVLSLLMAAGGLASVYALRTSSHATEQLAQERLVRMQEAQPPIRHGGGKHPAGTEGLSLKVRRRHWKVSALAEQPAPARSEARSA